MEHNGDNEQKIIKAARTLFFKNGYNATKTRDIAQLAGVNIAMLHYYFRRKEHLFENIFEEAVSELFGQLSKILISDGTIFQKIRELMHCYKEVIKKEPDLPIFILHEFTVNPDIVRKILESHKCQNASTENLYCFFQQIEDAIERKEIKPLQPLNLFLDILSFSLFPFMSKGIYFPLLEKSQIDTNDFIDSRIEYSINMICESIRPN